MGNVLPIFIFDPKQIDKNKNSYFSNKSVQFLIESLKDLEKDIKKYKGKLYYYYGEPSKVIDEILLKINSMIGKNIEAVIVNRDYTPYSRERDNKIKLLESYDDIMINSPNTILTGGGTEYKVFTPYYQKAKKLGYKKPETGKINFIKLALKTKYDYNDNLDDFYEKENILHNGGRTEALKQLDKICENKGYLKTRDIPSIHTTEMSAYNKYGCISIREFMNKLENTVGLENGIARQLYFRDFFYQIIYNHPEVLGKPFYEKFYEFNWDNKDSWINAWMEGKTGFPIIDAGIRQMLNTGFMHNRCRMLVASFFTKDLLCDWRIGEKFFAQHLYDYDVSQNNAGWQTVFGCGASSLDWFRVMNPWTQTKKFDKECIYIKQWIPELQNVDKRDILNWDKNWKKDVYYRPIIEHKERRLIFLERMKSHLK